MGTFFIEPLEDDDEEFEAEDQDDYYLLEHPPEKEPEIRSIRLRRNGEIRWNGTLDELTRNENPNVFMNEVEVENGEESTGNTRDHSPERSAEVPGSRTRVTSEIIARDGDNQNPAKLAPREIVHTTMNGDLKEKKTINKHSKWGNAMTILTKTAWEDSQNTCKENLIIKNEISNDEDQLSYTLSIDTSDSIYEKIPNEELERESIRRDHSYNVWLPEIEESREEIMSQETVTRDTIELQESNLENIEDEEPQTETRDIGDSWKIRRKISEKPRSNIKLRYARKHKDYRLLTLEYYQIKGKLQKRRIYYLKGRLKYFRTVLEANNKKLTDLTSFGRSNQDLSLSATRDGDQKSELGLARVTRKRNGENQWPSGRAKQSESGTNEHNAVTRDLSDTLVHEQATLTDVSDCLKLSTQISANKEIDTMERRETTLLREYGERCKRRDRQERRKERIKYLEGLVAEIPSPEEDIPDDEDREIEKAIENLEKIHNERDKTRKRFRIKGEVQNRRGKIGATIDATVSIKANPTKLDINKDAILISFLAKGNKIRMRTQLVGDIMIEDLEHLEIRMPEVIQRDKSVPEADLNTTPVVRQDTEPMEEDTTSSNILPEATINTEQETPSPETQIKKPRTKKSKKRKHQSHHDETFSESSEESHSDFEEETKRKKTTKKKKATRRRKTDKDDPLAIDERRKPDLSNRIRIKGRLAGYKEGFESTSKRPRCKKTQQKSPETTDKRVTRTTSVRKQTEETVATQPIATSTPTQKPKAQIIEELIRTPTVQPFISLDMLHDADIERARRMRPLTFAGAVAALAGPEEKEVAGPEEEEVAGPEEEERETGPETDIEEGDDDVVPSSQKPDDIRDGPEAVGDSQEMDIDDQNPAGPGGDH